MVFLVVAGAGRVRATIGLSGAGTTAGGGPRGVKSAGNGGTRTSGNIGGRTCLFQSGSNGGMAMARAKIEK